MDYIFAPVKRAGKVPRNSDLLKWYRLARHSSADSRPRARSRERLAGQAASSGNAPLIATFATVIVIVIVLHNE